MPELNSCPECGGELEEIEDMRKVSPLSDNILECQDCGCKFDMDGNLISYGHSRGFADDEW